MMRWLVLLMMLAVAGACGPAAAQMRLDGTFVASADCAANKKKDRDNPGNVHLEPGRAYRLLARNGTPGTHYQVVVPGAPVTEQRWVPMDCGTIGGRQIEDRQAGGKPEPQAPRGGADKGDASAAGNIELVLVASWQPAFCRTATGRNKRECRTQTRDRFDATHFSLHGLWPDDLDDREHFPCYCDRGAPVSCDVRRQDDRRIDLSRAVRNELAVVMPGMQSGLELHEWSKHGSCYEDDRTDADRGADPDEYFGDALALMAQLNASPVQRLFKANIGRRLTRDEIEAAFDEAFGKGASRRLEIRCSAGDISELWINLKGDVTPDSDLSDLIRAAPPTSVSGGGASCKVGRVAAVSRR